jgi:Divergent InlB B-repeat domain
MTKVLRRGFRSWWSVWALATLALAGCGGGGGGASEPNKPQLTVSITGDSSAPSTGPGRVTSEPAGLNCGVGSCSATFAQDTPVILTATAASGQRFNGWSGACSGSADTCKLVMSQARTVGAAFAGVPGGTDQTLSVSVTGSGTIRSQPAGVDCGSTCSASFANNTTVTLTATPASGQVLQGWGGACSSTIGNSCAVTLIQATSVSATFVAQGGNSFALSVAVTGGGSVSSQPAGISCGSTCSANFAAATSVVLTASPAQGQTLQAWGGACAGAAASCTVEMSAARSVTATFAAAPAPTLAWGTAALLENSNDFNVAGTNTFADASVLSAIDADGNALVVWQQSDGTPDGNTRKVFSRRYTAGQGWAAAVVVPGLSTSSSSVALVTGRLVMDAAGNATWIRHNFETRRYSVASGWSASAFMPATTGSGELSDAKVDSGGQVHMLGIGSNDVLYSRLPAGSSQWTAWADVSFTDQGTRSAQLALDSQGGAIAVWRERNPGDSNDSMKANRLVGGAWQTPVRIEEVLTNVNTTTPRIAADSNGNAIVAWHQGDSLYVNRFDAASTTWGTATEIDARQVDSTFAARIELAMAADGRAVVVWNSGLFGVKGMSYAPGTGFSAPATVTSYSSGHFLGIDREGRAVLVYRSVSQWPNPTDGTQNLYSRELPSGGAWSAQSLIEVGAGEVKARTPCAMNAAGHAVCAWAQDDLPNNTIRNSLWANLRR